MVPARFAGKHRKELERNYKFLINSARAVVFLSVSGKQLRLNLLKKATLDL